MKTVIIPRRIVAEITRNWGDPEDCERPLISERFEEVIATNAQRGYVLEDWKFQCIWTPEIKDVPASLVETIIAVFIEP